jgi:hypothetical protein
MTFLHPALLWLLPLAAVPVLLHLLTLHRLRTIELSTFRFLFDSYVQQRRRLRFLEALLAALRAFFLLGLVLLVSRPLVRPWSRLFAGGSGRDVVFLVDCSASMNARRGGQSALDRARAAALAITDGLGPDDRLTLVRVGARADELFSRFARDATAVREKIAGLEVVPARANFFTALTHVFGPGAERLANPVVYVFTDGQRNGWNEVRDQGLGQLLPAGTPLYVVQVGAGEMTTNTAVVGQAPRRPHVLAGLPVTLLPRVVNYSKTDTAEVTLRVLVEEEEIGRARLTLRPGEAKTHPIIYRPTEPGMVRGRFEINGAEPDSFPDDDQFLFALTVVPRVRVLLVNGNPSGDPLENEGLYLRTALASAEGERDRETGKPGDKEKARGSPFEVREVPEHQVNQDTLRDASVVILANCGGFGGQHFGWLRDFVAAGGGLLIFPGDRVNPDVYNTQFFPVTGVQGDRLTAAQLRPPEGDPNQPGSIERLTVLDLAHPILSVFDDPDAHYLRTAHFARRFPIQLPEKPETTWTLAELSRGTPALVESRFREGRVLLAAFPASARWSNLPVKPEWVPLVLRMVSYLERRPPLEVPAAVPADGAAPVSVVGTWAPATGQITDPAGRTSALALERSAARLVGAYDRTDRRGYYTVDVKSAASGPPRHATGSFAVNLAPEESEVEQIREDELRGWLPDARVTLIDASAEAQQRFGSLGEERDDVWSWLIALVFVIIGVEFLLATRAGQGTASGIPVSGSQDDDWNEPALEASSPSRGRN